MLNFILNIVIFLCVHVFLTPVCLAAEKLETKALVKRFTNIHDDDIHGIYVVDERHVVSGSKDTTVKLSELDLATNKIVNVELVSRSPEQSYRHWVTGIDMFKDYSVVVGHRNNYLLCKNVFSNAVYARGFLISSKTEVDEGKHVPYKARNEHRITGIKSLEPASYSDYSALIGMPEEFYHYDFYSKRVLGSYRFSRPEWVYGFSQIREDLVTVIHGAYLSLFRFSVEDGISHWKLIDTIVEEELVSKGEQRAFISSVFSMEGIIPCSRVALSFFGGATKIIDVETKAIIHDTKEHQYRVWQSVPFSPNEYISCSDDSTIKIWDVRAGVKSIHTYGGHPGRVSSVAVIRKEPLFFIAGTCPDDPHKDQYKGQFYLYDIRMSGSSFTSNSKDAAQATAADKLASPKQQSASSAVLDFASAVKKLSLKETAGKANDNPLKAKK